MVLHKEYINVASWKVASWLKCRRRPTDWEDPLRTMIHCLRKQSLIMLVFIYKERVVCFFLCVRCEFVFQFCDLSVGLLNQEEGIKESQGRRS